ncbi:ribonuclease E inhibitor RraA/Dimethylmenaquinone methyltransferase [Dioszegia hungarica]|uniref:Ribonuclease E inhibitor RraA/Dimethylmenaquinone methyltransferase n=1 Tax=Dioszegia hungarica TaxID=4972 RepID=A0AA38GZK1_9TREE|nr:ribonuclease E inhibitor RraA/Dimethylmenaquinone methyltransferase [Dioszegia hungarica]KAI9631773.1 ribonuclease E inhibitor RraA/Dimethylmenaquinone methyltransferase [Dioszegia hungarica]
MAAPTIIDELADFSACDCSDALVKLGVAGGGFLPGPSMWSPQRQEGTTKVIGRAYTVRYALLSSAEDKVPVHYIDTIPQGAAVVISAPSTIPNAVYGGLMSTRAQASGAAGTIVHGRVRDLHEHRALGYPVFASDVGTVSPYENAKVVAVNQKLELVSEYGTTIVEPGDIVVADIDGVVVIPRSVEDQIIPLMIRQTQADAKVAESIKAGMTFVEASKKHRV